MWYPTVDHHHSLDAGLHHFDAALDLRDHAAGDDAIADEPARLLDGELRQQLAMLVEHPRDVREQQQALGLHARGEGTGERVGIDVEGLPLVADADRRDDRNEVGTGNHLDDMRIDLRGIAYVADVDGLHQVGFGVRHLGDLASNHEVGILAGDADRFAALAVDGGDDVLVDEARQHHLHHLDRRLVRDPEAVHELALQLKALEHAGDLRSPTMDDDGVYTRLLQEHDVLREGRRQRGVAHGVTAILD